MAIKPKNILVIDIEATCWDDQAFGSGRNEIIEIGVVPIDIKTKTLGTPRSIIVLPPTTEISEFCTKLTTLTPEFVAKNGVPFNHAISILKNEFKSFNQIFASWGDYDREAFVQNCIWNRSWYPFRKNMHLNVKALFAAKMGFTGGQVGCGEALGVTMQGTPHRGVDDALNIAHILLKLLHG